jgi:plasmid stability protein
MATLYVDNFADDLYEALRKKAKERRSSIAAVLTELVRQHVPTESELAARRAYLKRLKKIHARPVPPNVKFPSTEEMLREDRNR